MSIQDLQIIGEDKLKRSFVLPKKVLWKGDGVTAPEVLTGSELSQIFVGVSEVTKLSNEDGKKGAILLDFGSEMVGSLEILASKVSDPINGTYVNVRFGESAAEAMTPIAVKNATNDHAVRDMRVLLTRWSQQTFGYTGYRFVYIEVAGENAFVDLAAVRGILTLRDIPYLGSFECSDKVFEDIYHVSAYTVHLCMQNMLWDGIKRDRLVWIGDTHPEMLAIRSVFGADESVEDALRFIPETNVLPEWPNKHITYGNWYLMILWDWYWYTGNLKLVEDLKDYWKGLLVQLLDLIHEEDEELLHEEDFVKKAGFFVDWPTKGSEEVVAGVYALYRLSLLSSAKLCELVGDDELKERCLKMAELLAKKNEPHNNRKQIVALLQLAGMIDDETAGKALAEGRGKGMSTFLSYYILSAAANTAGMDVAQEMLKEYYGAMLDAGATSFWEDFDMDWVREGARIDKVLEEGEYDIHGDNGGFCYVGMRHSLCHGWSAGPAAFLPERVLGIQKLEAGCKKLSVKPDLGKLEWAKGTYPTPYGVVEVKAWREKDKVRTEVKAPKEIEIVK